MTDTTAKREAQLHSGQALTLTALGHHLGVNRGMAARIASAQGLEPEGSTYPWRRIWRHVHDTEGTHLARHLSNLKSRYPESMILARIDNLEAELRAPLIDFAAMAQRLGRKPDTLSKALRQRREALPFPALQLGPRLRHFRPLEVRLWAEEEIRLDLPAAVAFDASQVPGDQRPATSNGPIVPLKKALLGRFGQVSRNNAA